MREESLETFGQVLVKLRRDAGLQLKEVAARVKKEDGQPISFQYLSDLEHDRRPAPSDHLIDQLAGALGASRTYLYFYARRLPADFKPPRDQRVADAVYKTLCENIEEAVEAVAA